MRTLTMRVVAVAVALVAAVSVSGPAQAAPPDRISEAQVNQTVNRFSPVFAIWYAGSQVELRAGWYNGYQYGWARLVSGQANWREGDSLVLQINRGDGSGWHWGPTHMNVGDGVAHTGGALTYASSTYRFRACLFDGYGYDCTAPW